MKQLSFLNFVDAPALERLRHRTPEEEPELPVTCATCGLEIKADVWFITYIHDPQGNKHHYWCKWPHRHPRMLLTNDKKGWRDAVSPLLISSFMGNLRKSGVDASDLIRDYEKYLRERELKGE